MGQEQKQNQNQASQVKVTWVSWVALFILIVLFSGVLQKAPAPWKAFDFANLVGNFGAIYQKVNFVGKGGAGAREALLFTFTLIPTVCLAVGLINVVESCGGLMAAEKLFRPLLRPLLGIPGVAGISFIASFTSSDIAAFMTKGLVEDGLMTDEERAVYVAYQYAGSAVIMNTINTQAPLLPIALMALGPIILLEMVCKIFGANLLRLYIALQRKKEGV